MSKLFESEFNKYLVSGIAAVIADFSVLLIATEYFGVHYLISNICGYMSGLLVAYTLNIRWVFKYRKYRDTTWTEMSLFMIIVLIGLAISEAIIFVLVEEADIQYTLAKLISIALIFLFNFWAKKRYLFTQGESTS